MPIIRKQKKCRTCKGILPIESFSKRAGSPDGHQDDCKMCQKVYMKAYQERKKGIVMPPESTNGTGHVENQEVSPQVMIEQLRSQLAALSEARERVRALEAVVDVSIRDLETMFGPALQASEDLKRIKSVLRQSEDLRRIMLGE